MFETDLGTVKHQLGQDAKQLAVLGEVDAARELIGTLYQIWPAGHDHKSVLPLAWAWKETSQWPEGNAEPDDAEATYDGLRRTWEEGYWGLEGIPYLSSIAHLTKQVSKPA